MTEPKVGGGGENDSPTIESLSAQIENLNKGIAKYRDDASNASKEAAAAKAEAKTALEEAARVKAAIEEAKEPDDPEIKLSPSDQKKLESWAQGQGFVTKEEMDAERQRVFAESIKSIESQAVDEFLKSHPELNKDEEWKKIAEQFQIFYKQPSTLSGYRQILDKIYKEIYGEEDTVSKARAAIETRKRLSLGGGNQKAGDEESLIDSYSERYPHLSREQISARVKEINELAEARAKRKASKK